MNKAKSYKILILFFAVIMCFAAAFLPVAFKVTDKASAATVSEEDAKSFFTGVEDISFASTSVGGVKVNAKADETLSFKNELTVNDFAMVLQGFDGLKSLSFVLESDSFFVNGNKNAEGKFDTEIKNTFDIVFNYAGAEGALSGATVYFNDAEKTAGETLDFTAASGIVVSFKVADNMLAAALGVASDEVEIVENDAYYKIAGKERCTAEISVKAEAKTAEANAAYEIVSVNLKASDPEKKFCQAFVLNDGKIETALPDYSVEGAFADYGAEFKAYKGQRYTASFKSYSVLGGTIEPYFAKVNETDKIGLYNTLENPKDIQFNENGTVQFNVVVKDGEEVVILDTYTATVTVKEDDAAKPVYSDVALEGFKAAVEKAATKDYGDDGVHSIRLGEDYVIPSMKDLVSDNGTAFEDLTHTVYYRTPTSATGSTTSWKIPVNQAGQYGFYVVFGDANGNKMTKHDFFNDVDESEEIKPDGTYAAYYFEFTVRDDAPMYVTSVTQGTAYLGIKYTASAFNFESSGYKAVYELYYNPSATAELSEDDWEDDWTLIPASSTVKESDEFAEGFDYDDIQNIGYNGSLSFTPDRTGTFAIKCTIASTSSVRSSSAASVIRVSSDVTTVKPDSHWVENNIWSVVFLSVGTLCLIGIVILLFIKPKDDVEESTGEEIKK